LILSIRFQNFPSISHPVTDESGNAVVENGVAVEEEVTFKKILLSKVFFFVPHQWHFVNTTASSEIIFSQCQREFEASKIDIQPSATQSAEETEALRSKAKSRKLGNIKFIGELFKRKMLSEKIIHFNCIQVRYSLIGSFFLSYFDFSPWTSICCPICKSARKKSSKLCVSCCPALGLSLITNALARGWILISSGFHS
jgi:hypothetical protein